MSAKTALSFSFSLLGSAVGAASGQINSKAGLRITGLEGKLVLPLLVGQNHRRTSGGKAVPEILTSVST